jgi:hypothetical protein
MAILGEPIAHENRAIGKFPIFRGKQFLAGRGDRNELISREYVSLFIRHTSALDIETRATQFSEVAVTNE